MSKVGILQTISFSSKAPVLTDVKSSLVLDIENGTLVECGLKWQSKV